ncbi:MAG: hypothetical protein HYX45_16105 [Burkholderiales bacterium]|nr:hypothetical protein [Burkholderiales bacterium]
MRFLLQWQHKESKLHREVRKASPSVEAVRTALRFFQVSRNFSGIDKDDRALRVTRELVNVRTQSDMHPVESVEALADAFRRAKFQRNISAASKLLWLSSRSPFKIYDDRAWIALRKLGADPGPKGDYATYFDAWKKEYAKYKTGIEAAVQLLPSARPFLPAPQPSETGLRRVVQKGWFKERVFDIYLWELGGEG